MVNSKPISVPFTLAYKVVGDHPINLDVYPPARSSPSAAFSKKVPAVIYFHGGALTVGNRTSWFPHWLHQRVVSSGIAFISADYQLIPPATGHDILKDIQDLFRFLQHEVNGRVRELCQAEGSYQADTFEIDADALAVSGSSAGGLCAYLAAMHASPRPKAILSLYGMGGDMLTWQYLTPKTTPFFRGREILDPKEFQEFLHPACHSLPPTSDSSLAYHPPTYHIPGYPANPRMLLGRLYLQTGTFLDYLTGSHEPSLSSALRELVSAEGNLTKSDPHGSSDTAPKVIPSKHHCLFPQFNVTSATFPPMLLVHGSSDTAVLVQESRNLCALVQKAGGNVGLKVVDGKEHSFDYDPAAEGEFGAPGDLFDQAAEFLKEHLWGVGFRCGIVVPTTVVTR